MIDTTEALGNVAPEGPHLRTHLLDLHLREVAICHRKFWLLSTGSVS